MTERRLPTRDEVLSYLRERKNWGRWGDKGAAGAINLIDDKKRLAAAQLVKTGRVVSLSRPVAVTPSLENPHPAQHIVTTVEMTPGYGGALDYYGMFYHGASITHIDALCHVWHENEMWEGRNPAEEVEYGGVKFGGVEVWSDGILTRGVLLDVTKHRGEPYVTLDKPVHGWELEDIAKEQGVTLEPGDAVFVYSGREAYAQNNGGVWLDMSKEWSAPGLHASCLPFIRNNDISILGWDMADASPNDYDLPLPVHGAIYAYGIALIDNALLEPLSKACAEMGKYEFMLTVSPLHVVGGTGSPVNPMAVF